MDKITITITCPNPNCGAALTITTTPGKHTLCFACEACGQDALITIDTRAPQPVGPSEVKG